MVGGAVGGAVAGGGLRVVGGAGRAVAGGTAVVVVDDVDVVEVDVVVVVVDVEVEVVDDTRRRGSSAVRFGNPATATPRPTPMTTNRARAQPCFRTPRA